MAGDRYIDVFTYLDQVLDDSEKIIAERSGGCSPPIPIAAIFRMSGPTRITKNIRRFSTILRAVLAAVAHYLKCIRFCPRPAADSLRQINAAFDHEPKRFKDSQLYHIDYYSLPNVYVIVLARESHARAWPSPSCRDR
jgi:hypothetical protein